MFRVPRELNRFRQMRLTINPLKCDGHGICALVASDVIALDEWGYPAALDDILEGDAIAIARRAVRACPKGALELEMIEDQP
jgi:ferredoxin